ncbi:MAG: phosphodiester glycosidase family protein [Cyanobacteria bacterium J06560_2]
MRKTIIRAAVAGAVLIVTTVASIGGYYAYRLSLRPERTAEKRALFRGITYERHVRDRPRPLTFHVITIDLTAPGINFLVTPEKPTDGYPLAANTVPGFVAQHGVQVAINGSYFAPHEVHSPFHYYPHVGDGVRSLGIAISNGQRYSEAKGGWAALCILSTRDIRITQNDCPDITQHGIAGDVQFVKDGELYDGLAILKNSTQLYPRSAIATNADTTKLFLVALDGRQSGYSEGVTLKELGEIMIELGAHQALNFDGGGSTTLAVSDEAGQPVLLNAPFQARVPVNLRAVANHFGVYAQPLPAEPLSVETSIQGNVKETRSQ